MKLNLGGGNLKLEGYASVDFYAETAEYRVDLTQFPWPFADGSVEAVAMFHVLEHVADMEKTVMEVRRILKTGGEFWVVVPHAKNPAAWDISHRHCLNSVTFSTITDQTWYRFNGKQLFKTVFFRMPLVNSRWIKWTPLDLISNHYPYFFEKFFPFAPAHIEWKGVAV